MHMLVESILLIVSAASSLALGLVVLIRNPGKITHRLFAVLTLVLVLWALGVLFIIHSADEATADFWLRFTFMVAGFVPVTFYHFSAYFPYQKFDGFRVVLSLLYFAALFQCIGSLTPWYLKAVALPAGLPPSPQYGPVFYLYPLWVLLSMVFTFSNLFIKTFKTSGVERRQVQHVLMGIVLCTTLAAATNILAPLMGVTSTEAYGPVFPVIMMGIMAYAMVRYHLMDIWVLISHTTIYASVTAVVTGAFLGTVFLSRLVLRGSGGIVGEIISATVAALVVVVILHPLKERLQLLVDRRILKARYDVPAVCATITRHASQFMRLDQLLTTIARDIRDSLGSQSVSVWLVDDRDPSVLVLEYSTNPSAARVRSDEFSFLLDYVRLRPAPIAMRQVLHERPTDDRIHIVDQLARLDAALCVPMCVGARVLGLVVLGEKNTGDIYSVDDLAVFRTIAGPLATAIENSKLYVKIEEVNLHLARILSSMRGGVIAVDEAGGITTWNASATEMFGNLKAGAHYSILCPPLDRVFEKCLTESRGVGDFEAAITGPKGDAISVAISASCLETPDGGQCGAVAVIHDLTQIKRLEQNVKRADRLSSIGMLAAGMAHEIKNPLVSVKTFTQLLPTKFNDEDFRSTFAEVVPHEVDRIDTIVSRLLDFARPKPVMFAHQDIIQVIEETLALVANQARKLNINVERDYTDESVAVYGDEQQLHQVFLNLFLNAMDAMKKNGSGTLTVAVKYDHHRFHSGNEDDSLSESDCVRVTVSDTGCGILPDHIEYLFTPFFTTKVEGCGLGLSVVHGIIMEHRGEIDVQSTIDAGASFTIRLPFAKDLVAAGAISEEAISITHSGLRPSGTIDKQHDTDKGQNLWKAAK